MTIEELVLCILEQSKVEEKQNSFAETPQVTNKIDDTIYSINQLIENYSIFTRYNINKAISEKGLPYFSLGSKKYFKKSEIEKWIEKQQSDNKSIRR